MAKITTGKMAERADRHVLYEQSVQNAPAEIDFIESTFSQLTGRRARLLREDFCGTANCACEWVRRNDSRKAWGIDLDAEVLDWAGRHHLPRLTPAQRRRLHLVRGNVLTARVPRVDVALAMNFSYWVFKDRRTMKRYFRRVRAGLAPDGVFFLDAFGGFEAFRVMEELTDHKDFTYIWDQADYNPITGDITCHIHFRFPDRSRLRRAFTYQWRLWTLPELIEMLEESGFRATAYWEHEDEHGEGTGEFSPATRADADAGWVAYIVAEQA